MSRRKQGRPQQRKTFDSLEPENDLLVCGDCQTSFPLQDIVQFIKHKNHACNKENVDGGAGKCCRPNNDTEDDDGSQDDGDAPKDLSNPKGSDRSRGKELGGGGGDWPPPPAHHDAHRGGGTPSSRDGTSSVHSVEMKEDERGRGEGGGGGGSGTGGGGRMPLRPKQVVDAEANTTHSEPSKFVCEACRTTLSSAWALLQHAQKEHGMKIYNVGASCTTSAAQSASGGTPPSYNNNNNAGNHHHHGHHHHGHHHHHNNNNNNNSGSSNSSRQPSPQPQPAHTRSHSHAPPPPQRHTPDLLSSPSPRPSAEHRTPPSSAGSGPGSPFPAGPLNPFTPFRIPLDGRMPTHSPFARPPELQLPLELLEHYRGLRPPHLVGTAVGVAAIPPSMEPHFAHSAFDRSRPMSTLESQIYSQRLKQLANPTLPAGLISPLQGGPFTPPVLTPLQPNAGRGGGGESGGRGGRDSVGSGRESTGSLEHGGGGRSSSSGGGGGGEEKDKERSQSRDQASSRSSSSAAGAVVSSAGAGGTLGSSGGGALSSQLPNKLKSCEFCGKMFRFQSNLIVHRRSHTGEKPFKCPLCPHACTQQSKLKRHMKTHSVHQGPRNASLTSNTASSDGSVRSTSSTPDSTRNNKMMMMMDDTYDMDDEDDDVDDDDDEDEEEDMEGEFTDGDYESGAEGDSNDDSVKAELDEAGAGAGDSASRTRGGGGGARAGTPDNDDDRAPTPTKRSASASLVSEVMKNTGLNCIQPYNDAFQAALAEKFHKESKAHDRKENGGGCNSGDDSENHGGKRSGSGLYLGKTDLLGSKSIKREPGDLPGLHEAGIASSQASLFRPGAYGRWLSPDAGAPLRTFFPGFPPPFTLQAAADYGRDANPHNGYSPGGLAAGDSALKVPTSLSAGLAHGLSGKAGPSHHHSSSAAAALSSSSASSLLTASNGNGGSGSGCAVLTRKESRRNDTCEFCGKVFKNCSNLTVHRRSHTGEKPYKCGLCNYACAQSSKLTRHMKTHSRIGKEVFKCKFCNMPFSVPSTLEKHMRKCVESRNARILAEHVGAGQVMAEGSSSLPGMMDQDNNSNNSSSAPSLMSTPVPGPGADEPISLAMDRGGSSPHPPRDARSPLDGGQTVPLALTVD